MRVMYVVQSYRRGKKGGYQPDAPAQAQNTNHARRMAERLAQHKALVIAFMQEGDPKTGEYEDPKLIAAFGAVPEEVSDMPRA